MTSSFDPRKVGTAAAAVIFVFALGSATLGLDYFFLRNLWGGNTLVVLAGGLNWKSVVMHYGLAAAVLALATRSKHD